MTISTCVEGDPRVEKAMAPLRGLDQAAVVKALTGYLGSEEATIRRSAIYILWKNDFDNIDPAVPDLLRLCSHDEDFTRGMAALALGARKIDASYQKLADMAVEDKSSYARRCAAIALGWLGREEAKGVLERVLKDSDEMVRHNAEDAIAILSKDRNKEGSGPRVINSLPVSLTNDVDPDLKKITVTFDQKMMGDSYSWTGGGDTFPKTTGKPSYDSTRTRCSLPVELQPGKVYWVGINSPNHKFFQTNEHVPATPYVILFATRSADGKPTTIPDQLVKEARAINEQPGPSASRPSSSKAIDKLEPETRKAIEDFERSFVSWFRPETAYETASAREKEAMIEKWIVDACGEDFKTRTRAIAALGNVASPKATAVLIKIAEEPMSNNRPKWMAVRGLGRIGDKTAVPTLIELIDHGNTNVRVYSRLALAQITGDYLGENKDKWREWWNGHGRKISAEDKRQAESWRVKGWQLWLKGKHAEAEEMFDKAVAADPGNANALQGLGWAQFNQGKPLNAKLSFEKCLAIEPKNVAALNGLGWIAKSEDKVDEAMGYWKKAVDASPEATAALNGLALTCVERKQYDEAIKYYRMWLKAEPNSEEAKKGLEKAESLRGKK